MLLFRMREIPSQLCGGVAFVTSLQGVRHGYDRPAMISRLGNRISPMHPFLRMRQESSSHNRKNQKINPVKISQKEAAVKWMIVEQQNIELLGKPYVTKDEETTYQENNAVSVALKEKEKELNEWMESKAKRPFNKKRPHFLLKDHFEHLNVRKKWE